MRAPLFRVPALSRIINGYCCAVVYRTVVSHIICHMMYYIIQTNILSREDPYAKRGYGGCNPPKFIISKIFWVNLWQLYYRDSTVFKFCTSMWLFSALASAFYNGCGLLAAIIFFSEINLATVDHLTVMRHVCCLLFE